jgi:hypothetical protein
MNARAIIATAAATAMMTITVSLFAADTPPAGAAAQKSEPIYGYRMMSDAERNDYRKRMREARSEQERQAVRDEHRKAMEARATERGVTMPGHRGPHAGGGYGPGGQGPGNGSGKGPRAECPSGQECPGPGYGKGPRPNQ